jgi:tRNA A37 methylthiotransferase MiaB
MHRARQEALIKSALPADLLLGFLGDNATYSANNNHKIDLIELSRIHISPFPMLQDTAAASKKGKPYPSVLRDRKAAFGDLAKELQVGLRNSLSGSSDRPFGEGGFADLGGRYQRLGMAATSRYSLLNSHPNPERHKGLFSIEIKRSGERLLGHLSDTPKRALESGPIQSTPERGLGIGGSLSIPP